MNKRIKLTLGGILVIVIGVIAYFKFLNVTYIDRTIKSYTNVNDYSIKEKIHNNHEWYAKISISKTDGDSLLKRYPFKQSYTIKAIAGKVQQDYIKECPDCWYYIEDKEAGLYGYILYCLSSDKMQLEIYQAFGD